MKNLTTDENYSMGKRLEFGGGEIHAFVSIKNLQASHNTAGLRARARGVAVDDVAYLDLGRSSEAG